MERCKGVLTECVLPSIPMSRVVYSTKYVHNQKFFVFSFREGKNSTSAMKRPIAIDRAITIICKPNCRLVIKSLFKKYVMPRTAKLPGVRIISPMHLLSV